MNDKKLQCPKCRREIPFDDTVCPYCGYEMKRHKFKWLLISLALLLILFSWVPDFVSRMIHVLPYFSSSEDSETEMTEDMAEHVYFLLSDYLQSCYSSRQELLDYAMPADLSPEEAEEILSDYEAEYELDYFEQALMDAQEWLVYGGFSQASLGEQLEYEGFLPEEVDYALQNVEADWDEQAMICAGVFLEVIPASRQGLQEHLEYNQFSADSIDYALAHCQADWKENAVRAAEEYQDENLSPSEEDLINYLDFQGFTEDEIEYALNAG